MTGPNAHATRSDPRACRAKRPTAITAAMVMRTIWAAFLKPVYEEDPPTADRMLIAGVMTPSPIKREIPIIASRETKVARFPDFSRGTRTSLSTHRTAFAFLAEVHCKVGVFKCHKDGECPDDQGENAHNIIRSRGDEEKNRREAYRSGLSRYRRIPVPLT